MKKRHGQKGVITVFVTLMMVPVVVITGMMVDVTRLKMYSSQAVMAADSYGEAVLSEYDNLLKELYGLFSITQNEDGLAAIETMKTYTANSFHPAADGKALSGFMPYKSADVDVTYEALYGASLSNSDVLMTQISDFMKYRVIEEVLADDNVLDTLKEFDQVSSSMDVMETRTDITDSSQDVLEEVNNYYTILEKINDYPSFIKGEEEQFQDYSDMLTEIAEGQDYADYVYYLENKEECDGALTRKREIEAAGGDPEEEMGEGGMRMADIAERLADYDQTIAAMVNPLKEKAWNFTDGGKLTDYDEVLDQIDDLEKSAEKIDKGLRELNNQIAQLRSQLAGCSQQVQEGIQNEIRDLEEILALSEDFLRTYNLIETDNQDSEKSEENKKKMEEELAGLDTALESLMAGEAEPGRSDWASSISFQWYSFREDQQANAFYNQLQKICGPGGTGGDKDAGKKKQDEAEDAKKQAEETLKEEEEATDARDIPDAVAGELLPSGSSGTVVSDLLSYLSGGLSFDSVGMTGNYLLDRFLVTTYDFGMFSSRVSGIRPEGSEGSGGGSGGSDSAGGSGSNEEYYDVSLTGYKISENINYLYKAELEYLLGGHNSSKDNLNEARNIICGVRLTMNFISTYTISDINTVIMNISNAAAAAVAASGVGAAVAPLVRVAVSGALRAAVATMETASDWIALKNREEVTFIKTQLSQLESIDQISGLLEGQVSGSGGQTASDEGLQLTYEDYVYVLLCLMLDGDTLMARTANLITLNVNQAQNSGDTLTELKFKMSDTVTAIKSTCKVKMDFVVVPDNFMRMYLSGTSTESLVEVLEDEYFGYSVIRGY